LTKLKTKKDKKNVSASEDDDSSYEEDASNKAKKDKKNVSASEDDDSSYEEDASNKAKKDKKKRDKSYNAMSFNYNNMPTSTAYTSVPIGKAPYFDETNYNQWKNCMKS
jgi:hypothetical protein